MSAQCMYLSILLIGLTLGASVSPLLTFAALFQQKEWRMDRLREHLRRDGAWTQLFGNVRPWMVIGYLVLRVLPLPWFWTTTMSVLWLGALLAVNVVQWTQKKQRMPTWTSKAILLTSIAFVLTGIAASLLVPIEPLLLTIVLLQPLFLGAAWLIMKPVDTFMKYRVMDRATRIRNSLTNATVIGIAGSVGKTTVKELINHLLQDLHPLTTPAHVNTEMGVSQWMIQNESSFTTHSSPLLIVEMGAYRKGEIALLSHITKPTIGVMTALGSDHLALFGSEEAIVQANGELIEALPVTGHAFVYGENQSCTQLVARARCPVTVTGKGELVPTNMSETVNGLTYSLHTTNYSLALHGKHNIHNSLLAIAVARHMGIADERIRALLATFQPPQHTFNVRTKGTVLVLDDTYNISPLSFKAALDWAGSQVARPRVLLTSGLQETGPDEQRFLQELGAQAAHSVERVIFTAPYGADIFAQGFGKNVEVLSPNSQRVTPGSVLLAVGRMSPTTVDRLLPFQA